MCDDNNINASYLEARDSLTGLEGHSLVTLMSCPSQVSSSNKDGEDKLRMDVTTRFLCQALCRDSWTDCS